MNTFEKRAVKLRKDIIAYVEDFLVRANRSIIVPKGALTYMDWDSAVHSNDDRECQLVPETEITMITLAANSDYGTRVRFVDSEGTEIIPASLDTEELLYVVDFLDTMGEEEAPNDEPF